MVGGLRGLCFQVTHVKVALEQEYASVSKIACCWECFSCFTILGKKLFPTRIYGSLFTIIPMTTLMNTRRKLGKVNLCKILLGLLLRRGKKIGQKLTGTSLLPINDHRNNQGFPVPFSFLKWQIPLGCALFLTSAEIIAFVFLFYLYQ